MELSLRCGVCKSYMDAEDLFCANCGTENPHADLGAKQSIQTASPHSFACQSCGASMSYDASAKSLRCPFCGSQSMVSQPDARSIQPDFIVPISIDRQRAESILREWLGKGYWRPGDAATASSIGEMASVYVPFWVFEASTNSYWTADSSPAPFGARGDWHPLSGQNAASYAGILVGGSSVLSPHETASIAPFRLDAGVPPERLDLSNVIVEEFRVPRKLARPLAHGEIEQLERRACEQQVPNRSRNVHVNMRISSLHGFPVLLPVWVLAYRYKKAVFRVLINGQTGKIAGAAPFSYRKLGVLLTIAVLVIALIVFVSILANT